MSAACTVMMLLLLPVICAHSSPQETRTKTLVQKYGKIAAKLASYAYLNEPLARHIPQEMKQSYEDNRGPFESQPPRGFSYTFGLHAYAFMHYQADTIFVTIRGTDFNSIGLVNDLQQDYKLYGSGKGQIHPWISPGQLTALELTNIRNEYASNQQLAAPNQFDYLEQMIEFWQKVTQHNRAKSAAAARRVVFVGHSLGGALASMMAIAVNASAIVFNSPGQLLGAPRAVLTSSLPALSRFLCLSVCLSLALMPFSC